MWKFIKVLTEGYSSLVRLCLTKDVRDHDKAAWNFDKSQAQQKLWQLIEPRNLLFLAAKQALHFVILVTHSLTDLQLVQIVYDVKDILLLEISHGA